MNPIPVDYQPAADLLRERVILVTGAGDGLGRATALACARAGATVVLLGRTVKKLEAVYDQIRAAGGAEPAIYPLHLSGASWNDLGEAAATLEREFGRLDGLVHCAVHFKSFAPLADIEAREWVESLQVNLTAAFTLTRLCLPLLVASAGSVVFVSDPAGREPKPFHGPYGVAKAGLESLARSWALEVPQVRFNTFDPGPMRTAHRLKGYPGDVIGKAPEPESVAPRLVWLLGPDAAGVSGCAV